MKKSELRKLIREIISEQTPVPTTMCIPSENCVSPELISGQDGNVTYSIGGIQGASNMLRCPEGFMFQQAYSGTMTSDGNTIHGISNCVPDIGNPGDYGGHGSPDDPFVPGLGFEDQFIDNLTGPGGPFGGDKGGKGKPIRERKNVGSKGDSKCSHPDKECNKDQDCTGLYQGACCQNGCCTQCVTYETPYSDGQLDDYCKRQGYDYYIVGSYNEAENTIRCATALGGEISLNLGKSPSRIDKKLEESITKRLQKLANIKNQKKK